MDVAAADTRWMEVKAGGGSTHNNIATTPIKQKVERQQKDKIGEPRW
jgi:hypothetical protein